ncbi:guanine nucleotide-binding protein subunit beta-like protein 1 isoform X1 [Anguilla rostrata]|uniref:guanine nucleotide-binding protein subunit beta-like protein 1 isoform X1 n=2 Tax=Anguilla rostrata TaxID=7938 RepID=UPI0030D50A8E
MFCSPRVFYCRCLLQLLQNNQKRVAGLHNTKVSTLGTSNKYEPNRRHQGSPVMALPPPVPEFILRGSGAPVNTLHFRCGDPGPPLLFSGSGKGAIHVWNLTTRRAEKVLEGHGGASVIWLDTLGSRDALISQGRDMRVCTWDLSEGRSDVLDSFSTGSVGFCQCSLLQSSGLSLLAHPGPLTEEIKLIDLASKTQVCSLKPDAKRGMLMCAKLWQPDSGTGPLLLTGHEDGWLSLWDVSQRRPLSGLAAHPEPVMCLDFDPAGGRGISGSSERALASWTLDGQQSLQLQDSVEVVNPGFSQLRVRQDRRILATAGWDHHVRLFGWKRLRPLAVLRHHGDAALCVAFSDHGDPRRRVLAAGSKDQRISVWSVYSDA